MITFYCNFDFLNSVQAFYFQLIDMNQTEYLPKAHEKYILILIWYVIHAYLPENDTLFNLRDTNFFLEYVKI